MTPAYDVRGQACRGGGCFALREMELVRGQTHSTSLCSAQGDKVGSEGFLRDLSKGLFGWQISRLRFAPEGELRPK